MSTHLTPSTTVRAPRLLALPSVTVTEPDAGWLAGWLPIPRLVPSVLFSSRTVHQPSRSRGPIPVVVVEDAGGWCVWLWVGARRWTGGW